MKFMKRPIAISIAVVMNIFLAVAAGTALRTFDEPVYRTIRFCYEGFILLNVIGCLAILFRAKGARLFTILLFMMYLAPGFYQAVGLFQSEFTAYALATTLTVPAVVAWVTVEFARAPVKRYFES
jgi:hypothetical protein